jgi:hypothetical protein
MKIAEADVLAELKALREDIHAIKLEISQYRGFLRGVLWSFSAVAATIGFFGGMVVSK